MRIKKLVLQNINSLYGKWEIDFDCENFRQSGIFAVTGKTGSGKSTILDAICLALYGTTPRLERHTTDAISRGCSECMSELTFLDTDNREWIATFAYKMIKQGKNKGKVSKDAIHRLVCNGKTEAEKTRSVCSMVEEITGLDFTRFCRAVLLAQGEFDSFLNAGKDNGEILERITGTQIYSRIAEKLKERHNREKAELAAIEAAGKGIVIMPEEELEQTRTAVETLTGEIARYSAEREELNTLMQKFQLLELHTKTLEKCVEYEKILAEDEAAFLPLRQRFETGKKLLDADEKYRPLKELLSQLAVDAAALQRDEQLLLEQEKLFSRSSEQLEAASASAARFQTEFEQLSRLFTQVNALDNVIKTLENNFSSVKNRRRQALISAWNCRREAAAKQRELLVLQSRRSENSAYLAAHSGDGQLQAVQQLCLEWLAAFKAYSRELAENLRQHSAVQQAVAELRKNIRSNEKNLQTETERFNKIAAEFRRCETEIAALLDGASRAHWENLFKVQEKCYHQALFCRSFDEHRSRLQDGVECPLCGSKEHPFAAKNIPGPEKEFDELQKIRNRLDAVDNAEKRLQKISAEQTVSANAILQIQHALEQAALQLSAKNKESDALTQTAARIRENLSLISAKIDHALAPFDLSWDKERFLLSGELQTRINNFEKYTAAQNIFNEKEDACRKSILVLHVSLKTLLNNCRTVKNDWKNEKAELLQKNVERQELFGTRDPAAEALAAEQKRKNITALLEKAPHAFTEISTHRRRTIEEINKLKKNIDELNEQISSAREKFIFACSNAGVTEAEFHAGVLTKDEMTSLAAEDAGLKSRHKQLAATRADCEKAIEELSTFLSTRKCKEDASAGLEKISGLLQEKNQLLGAYREKINQNEDARKRMAEHCSKLIEQQKVMELWNRLYDLIGVKDKFQRFAQGITLEHLLVLANLELKKLSGRYQLLRSQDEELGIDVADKDQGDEIRSCKTLSGGERFLVSLALALGLSQMAGEKIRVDSLFLDEGFGTLDAETLETALDALNNLRSRGKLVGVISHVAAFSEKIPCIIEVNKTGGGRSTLHGPGVKLLT